MPARVALQLLADVHEDAIGSHNARTCIDPLKLGCLATLAQGAIFRRARGHIDLL